MHASPRLRRLRNDFLALEQLREESSIFSFAAHGNPPHHYQLTFRGRSLCRERGHVKPLEIHRVEIKLGASYPRTMPEIRWITPIYHPNISEIGMVCLGGYGTNWVPSIQIDELCTMLWDMARYQNYDIRSPYNRDSALWASTQATIVFPTDDRPLRDLRAKQGRIVTSPAKSATNGSDPPQEIRNPSRTGVPTRSQSSSKSRRLNQLVGLIFGTEGNAPVRIESVTTRSRNLIEPLVAERVINPPSIAEPKTHSPAPPSTDIVFNPETPGGLDPQTDNVGVRAPASETKNEYQGRAEVRLLPSSSEVACLDRVEAPVKDEEILYII